MNWYKFLTETNKIHNDERPPDRLPMFQLVLREQGPLFKTVDKVICWINHLSSGQLLLLKSNIYLFTFVFKIYLFILVPVMCSVVYFQKKKGNAIFEIK
jgi:hypothetical protein